MISKIFLLIFILSSCNSSPTPEDEIAGENIEKNNPSSNESNQEESSVPNNSYEYEDSNDASYSYSNNSDADNLDGDEGIEGVELVSALKEKSYTIDKFVNNTYFDLDAIDWAYNSTGDTSVVLFKPTTLGYAAYYFDEFGKSSILENKQTKFYHHDNDFFENKSSLKVFFDNSDTLNILYLDNDRKLIFAKKIGDELSVVKTYSEEVSDFNYYYDKKTGVTHLALIVIDNGSSSYYEKLTLKYTNSSSIEVEEIEKSFQNESSTNIPHVEIIIKGNNPFIAMKYKEDYNNIKFQLYFKQSSIWYSFTNGIAEIYSDTTYFNLYEHEGDLVTCYQDKKNKNKKAYINTDTFEVSFEVFDFDYNYNRNCFVSEHKNANYGTFNSNSSSRSSFDVQNDSGEDFKKGNSYSYNQEIKHIKATGDSVSYLTIDYNKQTIEINIL